MDDDAPSIPGISTNTHDTNTNQDQHQQPLSTDSTADSASASAQLEWDMQDAAGLAPDNVPIAKVQRAWERKPSSPFSRQRFRVGKIMKRTGSGSANAAAGGMFNVHIRDPPMATAAGGGTPVKAVKKMRVDNGAMDRAMSIVSNWDARGSPKNRRIATRSSLGQEALIALPEDDDAMEGGLDDLDVTGLVGDDVVEIEQEADPEGTTLEIFDEDGTKLDVTADDVDEDDWEDESDETPDATGEEHTAAPDTTIIEEHVEAGAGQDTAEEEDVDDGATEVNDPEDAARGWDRLREELPEVRRQEAKSLGIPFDEYMKRFSPSWNSQDDKPEDQLDSNAAESATARLAEVIDNKSSVLPEGSSILPDGFVSPAVTRRRPISQVKLQNTGRRKTLPKDFASQSAVAKASEQARALAVGHHVQAHEGQNSEDAGLKPTHSSQQQSGIQQSGRATRDDLVQSVESYERLGTPEPHSSAEDASHASSKFSSPIPSISGSHPRLPLRRSPRRQSSSPFKGKSILKNTGKHHLVAFTPIKLATVPTAQPQSSPLPFVPSGITIEDSRPEQPVRSSSAPPEEPQITPRKQYQPRISDDTALLEAFLKRASESKNGKHLSDTARRESFERQSESSVVPQALASSPEEQLATSSKDVLGDLDPNSPSPRKASSTTSAIFHDEGPKLQLEYANDPIRDDQDEDELATESTRPQRFSGSRKSGRTKKKPETLSASTYSKPARISIKGSTDGVVLKQTEASRLATETRKNTSGNKKDAVMPLIRLKALRAEEEARARRSPELGSDAMEMEPEKPAGRRGITWSETLVSFYEGEEPEVSIMTDEPSIDPLSTQDDDTMTGLETEAQALPAIETPSKPRLRRLKPTRTASTPAKPTIPREQSLRKGEPEPEVTADCEPKLKPKSSTKRKVSRIATPAKPKRGAEAEKEDMDETMMADDETLRLDVSSVPPPPTAAKKVASSTTKKSIPTPASKAKATTSKLPAPATSLPMPGKENGLIASPPKKRMTKTSSQAAAAPARLNQSGEIKSLAPAPRFEIQKAAKSRPGDDGAMAGLISSPPKKARLRVLPGREVARGIVLGVGVGIDDEDIHNGEVSMRSPAKKRGGRRMMS